MSDPNLESTLKHLALSGMTVIQWYILAQSSHAPCKASNVSQELKTSTSNMTGHIDDLESRGFIERVRDADDRRAYLLQITPSGRKRLEKLTKP